LSHFKGLVGDLTEEEIGRKVVIYPYTGNKKESKIVQDFEDSIASSDKNDSLFAIIVDECHYGPTANFLPLLHKQTPEWTNVLTLLVSATPYNVLSNLSKIPEKPNVVDWMDVIKDAGDTYVGFEYYMRSLGFTCYRDLELRINDKILVLSPSKEYTKFSVVAQDIMEVARKADLELTCKYLNDRFTFETVGPFDMSISGPLLRSLGFELERIELSFSNNSETAKRSTTIDHKCPPKMELIRSDNTFQNLKDFLMDKFAHLSRSFADNDFSMDEDNKKRRKRTKRKLLSISDIHLEQTVYWKVLKREPNVKISNKESEMADSKNGFIIIIDYILSLCFHAVYIQSKKVHPEITEFDTGMVKRYLECVYESAFCDFSEKNNIGLVNLIPEIDSALAWMISEKRTEKAPESNDNSENSILAEILSDKAKDLLDTSTPRFHTWLTETDRIVKDLVEEKKDVLRERPVAPMVLMRCFDNDENESMQHILRNCLKVCNNKCGNVFRRESDDNGPERPIFSIIGDTSKTRLLNEIEPEFLNYRIEHKEFGECRLGDIPRRRAQVLAGESGTLQVTENLKYEDLEGLPCLLILCEKGRMGDTFPQTLQVLDLRLRTCQNGSGFIQELGRMSRYPATRMEEETFTKDEVLERMISQETFPFPYGCFLVNSSNNSVVSLVRTVYQLRLVLESQDSTTEFKFLTLLFPLPYALIEDQYVEALRNALDEREKELFAPIVKDSSSYSLAWKEGHEESSRSKRRILQKIKFPTGLDSYLDRKLKTPGNDFQYKLLKGKGHYDLVEQRQPFPTRMLLKAECQIGKTGAFLAFLQLLNQEIDAVPVPPTLVVSQDKNHLSPLLWRLPYWKSMKEQAIFDYQFPKRGKYHQQLLQNRNLLFEEAGNDLAKYISLVREKEIIISDTGQRKLRDLVQLEGLREHSNDTSISCWKAINWDNRFEKFEHIPLSSGNSGNGLMTFWVEDKDTEPNSSLAQLRIKAGDSASTFRGTVKTLLNPGNSQLLGDEEPKVHSFWMQYSVGSESDPSFVQIDETIGFSIPHSAEIFCWDGNDLKKGYSPRVIKSWIFTPSYYGRASLLEKYLFREDSFQSETGELLTPFKDYLQVLVVRKEQFDEYRKYFGRHFLIIALPETITYNGKTVTPQDGGCGYSRLFIQLFAEYIELDAVWMIDDNVKNCYEINMDEEKEIHKQEMKYLRSTFSKVIGEMEKILRYSHPNPPETARDQSYLSAVRSASNFHPIRDDPTDSISLRSKQNVPLERVISTKIDSMHQFTGPNSSYAIIGTSRTLSHQQKQIKHPIKATYSVYSFFLVNIAAIKKHKVYYPPRPIWEDIEMNHALEEKGLVVCKLQKFAHYKPPHGLRKLPPPPKVPELTPLQRIQNYFMGRINQTDPIELNRIQLETTLAATQVVDDLKASVIYSLFPLRDAVKKSPIFIMDFRGKEFDPQHLGTFFKCLASDSAEAEMEPSLWFWCNSVCKMEGADVFEMEERFWKVAQEDDADKTNNPKKYLIYCDKTRFDLHNRSWSFLVMFPPSWTRQRFSIFICCSILLIVFPLV
jgi:hypothetical protein